MADYGFVYVMGNSCMPNVYKVGMTQHPPMRRRDELSSSTSVPVQFDVLFYIEVENPRSVESFMHEKFDADRISDGREFFSTNIIELNQAFIDFCEEELPMAMTGYGREAIELAMYELEKSHSMASVFDGCATKALIDGEGTPNGQNQDG